MFFLFLSIFFFVYIYRSFTTQGRNFSHMPSSRSSSTIAPQEKYEVFLSFRGEDTRYGFTSHLYKALEGKQIRTFIDNELVRGDEISPSLLKAIEESKLSVLIFSKSYASSKWCLEELVKILECRKNNEQIVVPIFYLVDPSHVRNQTGSFGDAFARLIKEKALATDKVQSFRGALKNAANLSGQSLRKSESAAKFVEKIVKDILNKLHEMSSSQRIDLVGIDARVEKIESLLNMESEDVTIVGIWGMGGIGKTTIAKAVCNNIGTQFEGIFFANFREELRTHSMGDLQRSFLSQLLGVKNLNMGTLSFGESFIWDRLRRMKILIVMDDVDNSMQLQEWQELICRQHYSLGKGSKILVTSRDKQLLKKMVGEQHIYKVEGLNLEEARQLFSLNAFKNCKPPINEDLLGRMVNYAQGNPLALKVLGSALHGKSEEEWSSAMSKLALNSEIETVLKISYDGLDQEQKSIFLDIAHFFKKWEQNNATRTLDSLYGRSVIFDISTLVDKCLITISQGSTSQSNFLKMHDLLQQMAFSIVRGESKNPGERSRLCDPNDIVRVLEKKKGSDRIEGIFFDMSKLSREMHLESDAFAKMDRLRFLEFKGGINKVHLPSSGLEYLSDELRYLRWVGFPSKSLPQKFCAEYLIELNLVESKVEKLWSGVQDLVSLRNINLRWCRCLRELPDLSKANNLEILHLEGCKSLIEVPSSLQCLEKLEVLNLWRCYNLRNLPSRFDSKVLRTLTINERPDMSKCPEIISGNMEYLDLMGTSISEVPRSITSTLKRLYLRGCSNISKFPEGLRDIEDLDLSWTAIEEVPSSIQFLNRLHSLCMIGCSKLEIFPEITEPMSGLRRLDLTETGIKELPSSIQFLTGLKSLDMSGCSKLEIFPEITEPMTRLMHLDLRGTGIKELPSSIKHLVSLEFMHIDGTPIRGLPKLPPRLYELTACDCASLETISITNFFGRFNFANCFKLDQKPLIADMQLKIQSGQITNFVRYIEMVLPGSEIPEWFRYQGVGSSVTVEFPTNCHQLIKGVAFCLVFRNLKVKNGNVKDLGGLSIVIEAKNGEHENIYSMIAETRLHEISPESDHMLLMCSNRAFQNKYSGKEVTFKFGGWILVVKEERRTLHRKWVEMEGLERCGVYLHFDENLPRKQYFR